ncbi:tape measure protein [Lactobacillus helveticus]|uniref:SLT domain protein n=1 Tax=Lactobacillus helveticus CIRM-BIA 951 TaxID=1226334 RepID=U6F3U4_LACHE|nr:tape measure protein [Lactobacillus helveticus]MDY0990899.1 tape measure protein [Lactobacillus helveticus]MDY1001602.1 tape measure protein [Lactobacillus helveticus]MEB2873420.1 tape measure protein [Lactobacillus helveticus]CDI58601.1 SLT domain protein [Lactobacillus helveticus CIRM-BIA 951]
MSDGTIKIDIDIPVNKVKSDSHAVNEELERIGKNAGKDMDSSFKKNAERVKHEAKSTGESIDKSIGREHKTKIKVDSSEAKTKINETKHDLDKMPKKHEIEVDAEVSGFNRKLDEAKRKTNELPKKHNTDINATDHTGGAFARIKSHFDKVNEAGKKTHSLFGTIFSANMISNAATGAFGAVKNALGGMYQSAKQYALEQQTMNATWLTLTNSASKGRAMVDQINHMAVAAQNSTHMVDQLSQKFYAINNNAKQTGQLTKSILTLQDAFGQTDAAVENFGTQFSQMMANGKVSAQDMMSIVNTFPKLRHMLLDYERQIHHNSHMTMQEMNKMMSDGKIKSQDMINVVLEAGKKFNKATGNFTKTIPGMARVVKSQMPVLLGAFTKPFAKMESPIYAAVAKWVSSKKTNKEFQNLGKTVSTGMNNVMKAFSGGKAVDVTKALDNAINGINRGLKGVFGWISGHAKDLKTIASSIASIGGQLAKAVWKDFASIITTIGNMFGLTAKNGKKSGGAVHVLAEALNWLAKQKWAIHAIAASIVTIATVKSLDHVAGGLFSIGDKLKFLVKGMQGIKDIKDLSDAEQSFLKLGNRIRKTGSIAKSVFGAIGKLGKGAWNGIKFATKSFVKSFTAQLKIIGKGIKGLGSIAWNAAKSVGSKFLEAGRFLGSKIAQGLNASMKFGMGKRLAVGALAGAAVAAPEVINAVKDRHSATKRSQDIGGAVGALAGGTLTSMIPIFGPMLAPVGAIIGKYAGRWGGEAVNKFTKGWQRNKPPKKFWSLENLGWSAHSMWNGFTRSVGKTIKWFKKNWKEVGLYFISPLAGAINSLYKHNEKFHKWVDGLVKGFKNAWKGVVKWFSNLGKKIQKSWHGMVKWFKTLGENMAKGLKSAWHSVAKWFSGIAEGIRKAWHSMTSWFTKLGHEMSKGLEATWHNVVKFFSGIVKGVKGVWYGITDWFGKLGSNAVKGFKSAWNGIKSWFKGIIDGIKSAWDGFWDKVSGPFKFLGKAFSGKAKIGSIHFANGTDWQNRWGVPAILNDGNDSPQTNNRESLIYPDGTWELLPNKRNLKRLLPFGTDVVNARDTAGLLKSFKHFADGTLSLEDLNVSKSQENVLKQLFKVSSKQLQVTVDEARRKRDRDRKQAQRQEAKDHKSKKSKSLKITIDNKRHKGSVLADKGLLNGSLKETGHATWINEKLLKRIMSYTKAKPIKVRKNSRIRYRAIPTRRNSKGQYLVDSKWLTGAKKDTGKFEALTRDAYLKLLQFTKAERKYKLPKKRRETNHIRSTAHRRSTRRYSTGSSISRIATHVSASVSGTKIVNALANAVKSIKGKHNITIKAKASGRKSINKLAKAVKKVAGKHKVTIKTKGLGSLESLRKAVKKIKGSTHRVKVETSGTDGLKKLRSAISSVASESEKATKSIKGKGNFAEAFASLTKSTDKSLSKLRSNAEKDFKSMWSNLKNSTSSGTGKINDVVRSFDSKFQKQWHSLTDGTENIFNKFWKSMKSTARSGLNDVIGVLNSAISKIDNVINQFGGSKNAVHRVARLATGTGALGGVRRPITAPTLAILNDGNDSPETGNREAIWDRNTGNVEVVPGRFTPRILKPGQEVLNATETAMLGYTTPQHFATGTGALKELYQIAKHNWEHPQKTGQALFNAVTGLTGAINQLAQGARTKGENQGVKWWSQLWKMVEDKVNDGSLGPAKGLLKAVEKLGEGKPYVWGGYGVDAKGFDCSGLVSTALEKYFNSGWGHLDVAGLWKHATRIPKSEAKPGDPVFWLPDGHVGVYAGHNKYYSAFGPDIGMHSIFGQDPGTEGPAFGRFKGINTEGSKSEDEPSVKANNHLQKLIKAQVGKGFWKTIDKIQEKYGPKDEGGVAGKPYGDHTHWMKQAHIPRSDWAGLNYIVSAESGWNPKARNPSSGTYGLGQMQSYNLHYYTKHGGQSNPIAQLMGIIDYIHDRYGSVANAVRFRKAHNWYARGGIVSHPQTAVVGEGNAPESIIPWDPAYRGRALAIMQATLDHFMAQDGKSQRYQNQAQQAVDLSKTNAEIEAINEKFDAALAQLGILTSKNEVIQLTNTLDKRVIGEAMYAVTKNKLQRDVRNEAYRISGHH